MDQREAIKTAVRYIDRVSQKFNVTSAILFGSYAKGSFSDDSDIDIAVVLDKIEDLFDTQVELMKMRREIDLRIEPHTFIKDEFNEADPFANEILRYGINLPKSLN